MTRVAPRFPRARTFRPAVAVLAAVTLAGPFTASAQLTGQIPEEIWETFRWRSVGPVNMGGRVTDVEGLPSPSKTFYVAAAAGGIWKTTNNGITFRSIFGDPRVASMGDIAIAPSDPSQIWAGTGEEDSRNSISPGGGIFKSTDGGESWEFKGLRETQVIGRIVVHPLDPDIVFVAALGHIWGSNPERGLYRTTDGGDTWELVKFISDKAGFVDVGFRPDDPNTLFAASWERVRGPWFLNSGGPGSALWKSSDGGNTWTEVSGNGFPTAMKGRIGISISESNPDVMYAMVEAEEEDAEPGEEQGGSAEEGGGAGEERAGAGEEAEAGEPQRAAGGNGLYRSADGGETWEKANDANTRPFYYSQVRVDPQDPDRVYFSSTPVLFSNDGGRTTGSTTVNIHVDHHAMWIDPVDPERIVVGNDGGVAITYDKGGNWRYLNTMALGQFYDISFNMEKPYRVCGGLQDNGTWCGPSRLSRGDISKYHWATISGGDGFVTAQDPQDPNLVWAESQGGNMRRLNLATRESTSLRKPTWEDGWRPLQDSIALALEAGAAEDDPRIAAWREQAAADSASHIMRWNWNTPFFQSIHDRTNFYAAGNRVVKSTEFGDKLKVISPDLSYADPGKIEVSTRTTGGITPDVTGAETHATITALAESPLVQGLLYAGTDDGRVWMSPDDGGEWVELTDRFEGVPEGTYVSRIEPSRHDPGRVYVSFDGHRTNDFTPYVHVSDDGGASFRSIAAGLPTGAPDFVHVVREDPRNEDLLFVGTDVGVYASLDRGATWRRFMESLPAVPVHDLRIHPRDRELIAGTHGRSIWIVDIAPLQDLTAQVLADGAGAFEPAPAYRFGEEARGGESYGQAWFSRPTPGANARISYYIGEDVAEAVAAAAEAAAEERRAAEGAEGGVGAGGGEVRTGQAEAVAGGPGGRRGGPAAMMARGGPRVEITVTDAGGEVVQTLSGPARAGLHTLTWNMRGPAPEAEPLSPSERRDSIRIAERARVVADSLVEVGWDEEPLRRMIGVFTGESSPQSVFGGFGGGFGGGGGQGRDPEAFRERPGESTRGGGRRGGGRRGAPNFNQMRELAELIRPGVGMGGVFGGRRGGGGQGEPVEPGRYTVTVRIGDLELTRTLVVERPGETGES
ncbi:MAG: hypothetical protein OXU69_05845 [Gemmatimonadota bacterium]|nr:hypothetical protein [Gemmatimonadota bacterium]